MLNEQEIVSYFRTKYPRLKNLVLEEQFPFRGGDLARLSHVIPDTEARDQLYYYRNVDGTDTDFITTQIFLAWVGEVQETDREMDRNDAYAEVYRAMIRHEDKLRDDRTKALLTVEAFLIAGAGTVIRWFPDGNQQTIAMLIISLVGLFAAFAFGFELFGNHQGIIIIVDHFKTNRSRYSTYKGPPVIGKHSPRDYFLGASLLVPLIFFFVWLIVFIMYTGKLKGVLMGLLC